MSHKTRCYEVEVTKKQKIEILFITVGGNNETERKTNLTKMMKSLGSCRVLSKSPLQEVEE